METQVSEMVKNQIQHNLAMTIMVDQFHLLQTAIRGTV
jgi:flagellar basal body rod protein FlgB